MITPAYKLALDPSLSSTLGAVGVETSIDVRWTCSVAAHRRIARSASAFCGFASPLPRIHLDTGPERHGDIAILPDEDVGYARRTRRGRAPTATTRPPAAARRSARPDAARDHRKRAGQPSGPGNTVPSLARIEACPRPSTTPTGGRSSIVDRHRVGQVGPDDRGRDPRIGEERAPPPRTRRDAHTLVWSLIPASWRMRSEGTAPFPLTRMCFAANSGV